MGAILAFCSIFNFFYCLILCVCACVHFTFIEVRFRVLGDLKWQHCMIGKCYLPSLSVSLCTEPIELEKIK